MDRLGFESVQRKPERNGTERNGTADGAASGRAAVGPGRAAVGPGRAPELIDVRLMAASRSAEARPSARNSPSSGRFAPSDPDGIFASSGLASHPVGVSIAIDRFIRFHTHTHRRRPIVVSSVIGCAFAFSTPSSSSSQLGRGFDGPGSFHSVFYRVFSMFSTVLPGFTLRRPF